MAYKTIITDGVKAYDAPMNDPAAWVIRGQDDAATIDLKTRVGVVFRARELLSNAIANLPFALVDLKSGEDVDASGDWQNIVGFLPDPFDLLRRWRLSLMDTNSAYAFREGKTNLTTGLRYLVPSSIKPKTSKETGELIAFERDTGNGKATYSLKDNRIIYIWRLDETTELLPSEYTELRAITAAAGILYYADLWTSNYFQRGGVKPTLIAMKGAVGPTVAAESESTFDKFVRNISKLRAKVYNAEALDIKPFGDGVGDLKDSNVYEQAMQSVCAVTGIPISIFMSDAANRATADTYYYSWYKDKIVPDARLIAFQLNERLFHPMGMKLEFRAEQAEPNQEEEVSRSQAFQTYINAGISMSIAAEMMGLDLPQGVEYADLDKMQAEKEAKDKADEQARLDASMANRNVKGNPYHRPAGDERGGEFTSGDLFKNISSNDGSVVNQFTFPPSVTIGDGITLYHATSNPSAVTRSGLSPRLPEEIADGVEPSEYAAVTSVYLTSLQTARTYLSGRLSGRGEILDVFLPAGTVIYKDPIDYTSVFVRHSIPPRGIAIHGKAKFIPNLDQLREMERWQVFSFRKLKKGESLDFPFELRALPATVGDVIRAKLLAAKTEPEIKAAFDVVIDTPAPAYVEPDYSYLLEGIKLGVDALNAQKANQNGLVATQQAESNQADTVATS